MATGTTSLTNTTSPEMTTMSNISNWTSHSNFTTTLSELTTMTTFPSSPISMGDFDASENTTWPAFDDTFGITGTMEVVKDSSVFSPENLAIIHLAAIVSLSTSCFVSIGTMIYLFYSTKGTNFWELKLCERLVVYLAINDFIYSSGHLSDHSIIFFTGDFPAPNLCRFFGLMVTVFACMCIFLTDLTMFSAYIVAEPPMMPFWRSLIFQAIVVCFSALSACVQILANRKIGTGKYDWRLICTALGMPIIAGSTCWALGLLGPGPAWCLFAGDRLPAYVNFAFALFYAFVIIACTCLYISIWCKMRRVSDEINKHNQTPGLQESAATRTMKVVRTMVAFVSVQTLQWIPYVVYSIWELLGNPPFAMMVLFVSLSGLGGVFNCFAYTVVKKVSGAGKTPGKTPAKPAGDCPQARDATDSTPVTTEKSIPGSSTVYNVELV